MGLDLSCRGSHRSSCTPIAAKIQAISYGKADGQAPVQERSNMLPLSLRNKACHYGKKARDTRWTQDVTQDVIPVALNIATPLAVVTVRGIDSSVSHWPLIVWACFVGQKCS